MNNKNIQKYGYNDFFEKQVNELNISAANLIPARVVEVQKEQYKLATEYGESDGKLKGALFYNDKIEKEKAKWKSISKFQKELKRRH